MKSEFNKIERLKSYIENEKKYWNIYSVTDGSTEASYHMDTWLSELNEILKNNYKPKNEDTEHDDNEHDDNDMEYDLKKGN